MTTTSSRICRNPHCRFIWANVTPGKPSPYCPRCGYHFHDAHVTIGFDPAQEGAERTVVEHLLKRPDVDDESEQLERWEALVGVETQSGLSASERRDRILLAIQGKLERVESREPPPSVLRQGKAKVFRVDDAELSLNGKRFETLIVDDVILGREEFTERMDRWVMQVFKSEPDNSNERKDDMTDPTSIGGRGGAGAANANNPGTVTGVGKVGNVDHFLSYILMTTLLATGILQYKNSAWFFNFKGMDRTAILGFVKNLSPTGIRVDNGVIDNLYSIDPSRTFTDPLQAVQYFLTVVSPGYVPQEAAA